LESREENKICPRLNVLDAMSMEILRGIVQTIKTKKRNERSEAHIAEEKGEPKKNIKGEDPKDI